jgi:DNA (cytosine-5)-methyltransferase 1
MKHYGDITKISGAAVEPVNVIIGGSPCQDLSVAGKQKGIKHDENGDEETTRSGLFMEQLRIIKEMRRNDANNGRTGINIRPRYMVWENVPGAFSSNGGADFQTVLEETIKATCEKAPAVPVPKHGWPNAGCLADMGGQWSLAWRVFDAQFWGVPQRRKRIALVADFGGLTAPEILFERESLSRNIEPGRPARESPAAEAAGGTGAAVGAFCIQGNAIDRADNAGCNGRGWADGGSYTLNTVDRPAGAVLPIDLRNATRNTPSGDGCGLGIGEIGDPVFTVTTDYSHAIALEHHPQDSRIKLSGDGIVQTLAGNMGTGGNNVPLVMSAELEAAAFMGGQGADAGSIAYSEKVTPTLRAQSGGNTIPMVMTKTPPPVIAATCGSFTQAGEGVSFTLMARDYKDPQIICYQNKETVFQ